ncbi:MAG TPA: bifunctional phosphoribosylaminoimidazolecarboxamide formyltransferase/IMP cyclohydrolase [Kiritimatiellia bacterium]|nr:bifunctional phosphoribosylaminoimidazolecarboxamide formyltransferase/IMP cyclohydrolase [Kiritimatiellia bacterium]HMO99124.1 bifunctional phosphoribosylaminoimidazolecarboxamide formyltransferase/IMP cyclohydrolase [Kiritimatiellia bacterium]HMP95698.1 bifunctional phosphoribosylaminoimidazolecarboxamide formyltransferase/IMP cyclohydrolase [Kiritimatiellia bacterium]
MKIQRALISVSDKAGVVAFARELASLGIEILSTGGTAKALAAEGVPVRDVSDFTGFPEMLDGRVKTLHPRVHAGLLHLRENPEHQATMKQHGLDTIDLVCVNLYPFEQTIAKENVTFEEAIENIDIGGPTMLRSAAKNHAYVTVVTDPVDYPVVIAELKAHDGATTLATRLRLAQKVYAQQARYDAAIAGYLSGQVAGGASQPFVLALPEGETLRYGENPHQEARFYRDPKPLEACIAWAEILHGKEMSYNNYLDADAALEAVRELAGQPGVAIIKHSNPCGYATGRDLASAFEAAWAGDPVSAFGSVIAVTQAIDLETAKLFANRFIEVIIAPEYAPEALDYLKAKSKNLRVLKLHRPLEPGKPGPALRQINGGLLVQDRDLGLADQWSSPTAATFPDEKRVLGEFGIKVCKHVKSNAIVIVREYAPGCCMLLGMGAGQPNRVDALRKLAVPRAEENIRLMLETDQAYGASPSALRDDVMGGCVLVSDAFFPFPDNIEAAAEAGIRYIIQPGGSKKDEDVVAACDRFGIAMVFTGMRHFRH